MFKVAFTIAIVVLALLGSATSVLGSPVKLTLMMRLKMKEKML